MTDLTLPPIWARLTKRSSVRRRIERRARELGRIARQKAFEEIVRDLALGRLDEAMIPWWAPIEGGVGGCAACREAFSRQGNGD